MLNIYGRRADKRGVSTTLKFPLGEKRAAMEHITESWVDEPAEHTQSILSKEGSTTIFTPSMQMLLSGRIWVPEDIFKRK